jgi:hypothetical protein
MRSALAPHAHAPQVRGSHKLQLPCPADLASGASAAFREHVYQPATKAGDVVLWSEATIHGATPWRGAHQRRLALYRFAPANMGYGRGYLEYPQAQLQQMTPMQRAVLEPPYADRLDRPLVTPRQALEEREGEPPTLSRNEEKRKLDEVLFGTKYF